MLRHRMVSIVWCLHAGPVQVSCGIAETRRAVVLAFERRVRDFTVERRMAFFGGLDAARVKEGRRRAKRKDDGRCILVSLYSQSHGCGRVKIVRRGRR